jgi:hypothetical protein
VDWSNLIFLKKCWDVKFEREGEDSMEKSSIVIYLLIIFVLWVVQSFICILILMCSIRLTHHNIRNGVFVIYLSIELKLTGTSSQLNYYTTRKNSHYAVQKYTKTKKKNSHENILSESCLIFRNMGWVKLDPFFYHCNCNKEKM